MKIKILYFAGLKDLSGCSEEFLEIAEGSKLEGLSQKLCARFPRLQGQVRSIAWALNLEFAPLDSLLQDGDEVALLPPVSGGAR